MIFQKLFSFLADETKQAERRLKNRYAVGPSFPLSVALTSGAGTGRGRIANISAGGLGVIVDQKPEVDPANPAQVSFILEGFEIKASAHLRYVRPADQGFHCGLTLGFSQPENRTAYLQLLVPIAIGSITSTNADNRVSADIAVSSRSACSRSRMNTAMRSSITSARPPYLTDKRSTDPRSSNSCVR